MDIYIPNISNDIQFDIYNLNLHVCKTIKYYMKKEEEKLNNLDKSFLLTINNKYFSIEFVLEGEILNKNKFNNFLIDIKSNKKSKYIINENFSIIFNEDLQEIVFKEKYTIFKIKKNYTIIDKFQEIINGLN